MSGESTDHCCICGRPIKREPGKFFCADCRVAVKTGPFPDPYTVQKRLREIRMSGG